MEKKTTAMTVQVFFEQKNPFLVSQGGQVGGRGCEMGAETCEEEG